MSGDDLHIGRLVTGRYRLDELLGQGGFGSVYKGWDTQIGRDVAVKLLDVENRSRSAQQTAELRERFRREAMAAGRINHRGVVTIYDFGVPEDGGEAYLVMELLEGRDLADELALNGPMLPDRAQRLFVPLLEGLGQGHHLGIVHKDIKPQNIFLTHPGTNSEAFCLVDFGVARVLHEDKLTMTGLIVGTPQYMAPEYITDTLVTPALDVYQMALILVELITGMPAVPSGESFVKSCNRHFTGELDVPEELYEGEFGSLLKVALKPNPRERLEDASEFARRLSEIDPSAISIDSQSTMVFNRAPREVDTFEEPPLFPPMRPEEVTAELERERNEPPVAEAPRPAPMSTAPRGLTAPTAPVDVPPLASVIQGPHPVAQTEEEVAVVASGSPLFAAVAVALVVAMLGGGAAFVLLSKPAPSATPPQPGIVAAPDTPKVPQIVMEEPATVEVRSSPTGAAVVVGDTEIGTTPIAVAIGRSPTVELRLAGYENAVVSVREGMDVVTLAPVPEPVDAKRTAPALRSQKTAATRQERSFEGRTFDPEAVPEAEVVVPAAEPESTEPESEPETEVHPEPQKFERKSVAPAEKWNSSPVEIAK